MKNILIPTSLEADTTGAVATAIKHARGNCTIVLLLFTEAPDVFSAVEYLNRTSVKDTFMNSITLRDCRRMVQEAPHCNLQIHHQYGLSKPLLRNFLECKNIDFVIIPESVKNSLENIYKYCALLLLKSKYPILLPGTVTARTRYTNAMYLEQEGSIVPASEIAMSVNAHFPYKVVSHAQVVPMEDPEDLRPLLAEAIFKNDIDLVIETRNPQRKRNTNTGKNGFDKILGLPVLSLHEGIF